ncbi:hypothetical protein ACI702_19340, partial [Bacillus velezensis]|uniref:hypothetical protein n=1 Tax=Bacillus velezensis TaxID=492670 RepID=UPI00385D8AB5
PVIKSDSIRPLTNVQNKNTLVQALIHFLFEFGKLTSFNPNYDTLRIFNFTHEKTPLSRFQVLYLLFNLKVPLSCAYRLRLSKTSTFYNLFFSGSGFSLSAF